MLKALIIDDEMYVRKQMRRIVPWEDYGIAIMGEAENGRAALESMARTPVDIIFTDLEMPGLSGIAFLKAVRDTHPGVRIVVLTMHQEFEYIQKAMRLGVDDYIAKVQITEETFGSMLREILLRIQNLPGQQKVHTPEVDCLYYEQAQALTRQNESIRLSEHFFLHSEDGPVPKDAVLLHVSGLQGENYRQLLDLLTAYVEQHLFYEYLPGVSRYALSAQALPPEDTADLRREVEEQMSTAGWLLDSGLHMRVMQAIPSLHLPRHTLIAFIYQPFLRCASYLGVTAEQYFDATASLTWWYQWRMWFSELQDTLESFLADDASALHGIAKALLFIDAHFHENIALGDVLRIATLSKSHFSHLFKETTGLSFVEYVKSLRVERAKAYLSDTAWPLAQVAYQVGYTDERYFRRVFMDTAGITPAQYRRQHSPEA